MSAAVVRYEPSASRDWVIAVAAGRALVLSGTLSPDRRASAWAAFDANAPLTEILDCVVGGSLTGAPDFTLVGWEDGAEGGLVVHVFARGSLGAALTTAAGTEAIDAAGVATWAERRVVGVRGIAVGTAVSAEGGLPIAHGMVCATGFVVGSPDEEGPRAPAIAAPVTAPPPIVQRDARASEDTIAGPIETSPPPVGDAGSSDTIAGSIETAPPSVGDAGSSYDHLFGATVMRPLAAAAVRPPSETPEEAEPAALDDDPGSDAPGDDAESDAGDHTIMTKDLEALRARRRSARGVSAPASEPTPLTYFLEASDGRREVIDGTLLLGRAPVVTRVSGSVVPRLVKVTTPNQELSRTHVEVKIEGGAVVVTDLHSKNGTLVTPAGKPAQQLRAGEPTTVIPGSTIDLGDTAIYTVGEE